MQLGQARKTDRQTALFGNAGAAHSHCTAQVPTAPQTVAWFLLSSAFASACTTCSMHATTAPGRSARLVLPKMLKGCTIQSGHACFHLYSLLWVKYSSPVALLALTLHCGSCGDNTMATAFPTTQWHCHLTDGSIVSSPRRDCLHRLKTRL